MAQQAQTEPVLEVRGQLASTAKRLTAAQGFPILRALLARDEDAGDPRIPLLVRLWKGPLKWIGSLAMFGGVLGVALHYLRFGPKKEHE